MTKQIEDYPELEKWLEENEDELSEGTYGFDLTCVEQKLIEMQSKIDSLTEQLKHRESLLDDYVMNYESLQKEAKKLTEQNKELQEKKLNQYVSVGYTNFRQLHYMMVNEFSQDAFQNDDDAGLVFQVKCDGDFEVYVSTTTWNRYQDELNKESK